ncbi:transporter substrate-binding domain-containing protein [Endozoicomonas sp. SM1973]|uniref:Transporter substrate-binding domain-containing protein n=1 Tax=Spartinivicinus marinus TaxID=2994442 RepID=A0A853I7E2_9GAMM|nr:transporter substrate-binding domain-containing protein [Spartinivicinus marinus]MCX4029551.1 transporter substrate-binding domain-containing protein [Spartinivicinus marinus]NYZ65125.1 transporter substrate-binding domain-containing protein [Spartinivicinus marinus]
MPKFILLLLIAMTYCNAIDVHANSPVIIWTYYSSPPFSIDNSKRIGLTYDFVDLLNKLAPEHLHFLTHFIPRKRLDVLLKNSNDGIVIWVNPAWFNDKQQQKYLWTSPLMQDTNEVISLLKRGVLYKGKESLRGLQLGGVLGHVYDGLEESIQQGAIKRFDVASFHQSLIVLIAGRVDFTIVPNNAVRYLAVDMGVSHLICHSPKPHSRYSRHMLVQSGQAAAYQFLENIIKTLPSNKQWQAILDKYHLTNNPLQPCNPYQ